jgi:radical SAM family uncharacterized protein/radical SAM-linked protein
MKNKTDIERLLPLVQRPTRYIDHEWNAVRKERKAGDAALCLCFPDLYEVGASNLGLEILYHLVNGREDAVAERCFAPAADMEEQLKKEKVPLCSLESFTPLKSFDIVGFSLQYELCSTNILNMLHLAHIPLYTAERTDIFPLIIGGGPMTANPEPMADFFDAFVLGDGEEAINEIIDLVKKHRATVGGRNEMLALLAQLPGVYVPSLYAVGYTAEGAVANVTPRSAGVPAKVNKRTVNLDTVFFPDKKIVPYIQTIHNRLNIEVARGCPGRCRFCQAQKYYWPWRLRTPDKVLELTAAGLASTGFEEVAFSSLSCTDYKDLGTLLTDVNGRYGSKRVNISLPSLRCDQFSVRVAKNLGYNKRSSLTFAPEAGSDRLRNVIGKDLPETDILATLALAHSFGWRVIKLYFMIGLPTETEADIEGINGLVRAARRQTAGLNFNITVSPYVPKAQTPFQWVAMAPFEQLLARMKRLERILPATVKGHYVETTLIEGVMARGDRRLSQVIFKAWQKGAKFDQWREFFRYPLWQEAFKETGLDPAFYLYRERGRDEVLPWDHLIFGAEKEALWKEYQNALDTSGDVVLPKRNEARGVPELAEPKAMPQAKPVQRLRLRFARHGVLRFLSHLEQIEVFRRVIRRTDIPVAYTAGFSPQLRMAFGPAISVGYESDSEYVEVELLRNIDAAQVQAQIQKELPAGFEILSVRKVPVFFPSLDSLLNVANYEIKADVTDEQLRRFLAQSEIIVEKKKKDGRIERIDAKPLLLQVKKEDYGIFLQLRFGPKRNVKPERLLQQLLGLDENAVKQVAITRVALLIEKKDGTISEP